MWTADVGCAGRADRPARWAAGQSRSATLARPLSPAHLRPPTLARPPPPSLNYSGLCVSSMSCSSASLPETVTVAARGGYPVAMTVYAPLSRSEKA